jgi:maleate isomerase
MIGWRTRIGILVPPGNPTVEPEMAALAPRGVSVHFSRMMASGHTGSLEGQEARNLEQLAGLDQTVGLLALVKPQVVVLAHTATSYTLGVDAERELIARMEERFGFRFITAFGSVVAALRHLGISRVALGTPYGADTTLRGKALLETHGFEVPSFGNLANVKNIYDETNERAYGIGRQVDHVEAQAVFISGVGMPTIEAIESLECDIGKPVISAASAMMWHALRIAGVNAAIGGYGKLLRS